MSALGYADDTEVDAAGGDISRVFCEDADAVAGGGTYCSPAVASSSPFAATLPRPSFAAAFATPEPDAWCFQVAKVCSSRPADTLLLDSGADEHICRPTFAADTVVDQPAEGGVLRDVQGNALEQHGSKRVALIVGPPACERPASCRFRVAAVSDDILSLGKLKREGFHFVLAM